MGTSKLKVYLTVGISASGKTSWAKTNPISNAVYITRDDIRFNLIKPGQTWADYKFNKENEQIVSNIQRSIADQAVKDKKNIVIVDTNLSFHVRQYWKDFSQKVGYEFEIIDFECSFEEAVKRDNLRANGVGQSVIRKQYKNYLEYSGFKFYIPDEAKQYNFKSKGEKHSVSKVKVIADVDIEKINKIKDFVDYSVTENRLNQGIEYLKEMNKELDISNMGDFLRWLANDVLKEEQDVITENGLDNNLSNIMKSVSSKGRKWFMDKINE